MNLSFCIRKSYYVSICFLISIFNWSSGQIYVIRCSKPACVFWMSKSITLSSWSNLCVLCCLQCSNSCAASWYIICYLLHNFLSLCNPEIILTESSFCFKLFLSLLNEKTAEGLWVKCNLKLWKYRHRNGPIGLWRLPYLVNVHPWSYKCSMFVLSHRQSGLGRYA